MPRLIAIIFGLKESCPKTATPTGSIELMFGHAYKGQIGRRSCYANASRLRRHVADWEYLTDNSSRAVVAAFGYWAGFWRVLAVASNAGRQPATRSSRDSTPYPDADAADPRPWRNRLTGSDCAGTLWSFRRAWSGRQRCDGFYALALHQSNRLGHEGKLAHGGPFPKSCSNVCFSTAFWRGSKRRFCAQSALE